MDIGSILNPGPTGPGGTPAGGGTPGPSGQPPVGPGGSHDYESSGSNDDDD